MTLGEKQIHDIEAALNVFMARRRPPVEIRTQKDLRYRIEEHHLYIFEISPDKLEPKKIKEIPVAKASYIQSRKHWRVYWMGKDHKWQAYSPLPNVETINTFLEAVATDPYGCFWV